MFQQFPQIETERLILREIKPEDDNDLFRFFSDREVMKYYNISPLNEIKQARDLINQFLQGFVNKKVLRWGITLRESSTVIGTCGFHHWDKQACRTEIGYELSRDFWRRGIMTEAIKAIVVFGFNQLGLNRVEAVAQPENVISKNLLTGIGFKEEGLLREYRLFKGNYVNLLMLSLLKRDIF